MLEATTGSTSMCPERAAVSSGSSPVKATLPAPCGRSPERDRPPATLLAFIVALGDITSFVNPDSAAVSCLTVDQSWRVWQAGDPAMRWRDLDAAWTDDGIA